MLFLIIVFLVGLGIGFGVSYLLARRNRKIREKRQFQLRDAILEWEYFKHGRYGDKLNPGQPLTSLDKRLMDAIHNVGTMNIMNHDRW